MIDPLSLGRLILLLEDWNESASGKAIKMDLPGESQLILRDASGNSVQVWTDDGKFMVSGVM